MLLRYTFPNVIHMPAYILCEFTAGVVTEMYFKKILTGAI